ncbi:MAG: hypothetical protein J7513_16670 [Solirubrobacteraceae bacterium]|nr:hypothetical protein [Solirubrobacteraceae bacterium]
MPPSAAQARPFLTALRDRWWVVALCAVTAGLLAFFTVGQRPGQYQAGAILGLKNQYLDRDIFGLSSSQKSAEQTLAEQPGQLDTMTAVVALAKQLGLQPVTNARELAANTSVALDTKYYLPVVQGRDRSPERAAELANAYALVLVQRRRKQDERRMQKAIEATRARLDEVGSEAEKTTDYLRRGQLRIEVTRLTAALIRLRLLKEYRPPTLSVARWAPVPTSRTRAPALNIGLVSALFGAMMGCALLGWREQRDRRPRAGQVRADLRAAILSDLPRAALLPGARPRGPFSGEQAALEAVRKVVQADQPHTVVAVTEAVSLGRAGAAARLLAETAAAEGSSTLLASNDPHLSEGEQRDGFTVERYPIGGGKAATDWLSARRKLYDLVVLDLPSPVGSSAALELASAADQVLVVWVADSVTRPQVARLGRTLRRADISLAGVVRVGGSAA